MPHAFADHGSSPPTESQNDVFRLSTNVYADRIEERFVQIESGVNSVRVASEKLNKHYFLVLHILNLLDATP